MKKCSYCGAEYPDDVVACPIDQTPFTDAKLGSRSAEPPQSIGPAGYWLIFSGIPVAIIAILAASTLRGGDIRGVSERALPYVVFGVPLVILVGCRVLYHHVPKRLIVPLGFFSLIIAFLVTGWFFLYGPGVIGNH